MKVSNIALELYLTIETSYFWYDSAAVKYVELYAAKETTGDYKLKNRCAMMFNFSINDQPKIYFKFIAGHNLQSINWVTTPKNVNLFFRKWCRNLYDADTI